MCSSAHQIEFPVLLLFQGIINPSRQPSAPIVVENYPLIPRSLDELETIRQVIERRRIEIAEKKLRRQIFADNSDVNGTEGVITTVTGKVLFFYD